MFAADAMAGGNLAPISGAWCTRPIDAVYTVPAADVVRWAGGGDLQVELEEPVGVDLDGDTLVVEDGGSVAAADLPAVLALGGGDRAAVTALQTALVEAALDAAALRPEARTSPARRREPLAAGRPGARRGARAHHVGRRAWWSCFPAGTRVAEGQFAFVPDPEAIRRASRGGRPRTTPA